MKGANSDIDCIADVVTRLGRVFGIRDGSYCECGFVRAVPDGESYLDGEIDFRLYLSGVNAGFEFENCIHRGQHLREEFEDTLGIVL